MAILPRALTSGNTYIPGSVLIYGLCLYAVTVRCTPRIVAAVTAVTIVGAAALDWPTGRRGFLPDRHPAAARHPCPDAPGQRAPAGGPGAPAFRRARAAPG
ncbi:MAG: hypothetical protein ACRDN0_34035, partial [Trebonia sp.]